MFAIVDFYERGRGQMERGRGGGRGQLFRGRGRGQGQVFWHRGRGLNEDLTSLLYIVVMVTINMQLYITVNNAQLKFYVYVRSSEFVL